MLVTNWKLVTGNDRESTKPLKLIELHCGYALQPLKSDSETYKVFLFVFPISIISSTENVSHKLKISNRNDRESTKPLQKS